MRGLFSNPRELEMPEAPSGLSLSCEIKEINIGFELRDGADQRQQSLTGQIGSDGPARSEYKESAGFTEM